MRVRRAIEGYLDDWAETGMNWDRWMEEVDSSKREFARLIGAAPAEVSMHGSASQAIASIASSFDYSGKRNKVVVTEADFPTVVFIWKAFRRLGVELEIVPVVGGEIDPSIYEKTIDDRTLITSIPQVYYQNGFKQDIALIAAIAHKKGSLAFVDAYQALGTEPVDVRRMDIDILVSGNLKYLLGLPGSAYLFVKQGDRSRDEAHGDRLVRTGEPVRLRHPGFPVCGRRPKVRHRNADRRHRLCRPGRNADDQRDRRPGQSRPGSTSCRATPSKRLKKGVRDHLSPGDRQERRDHFCPGAIPEAAEAELKRRGIIVSARGPVVRLAHHFFVTPEDIDRALDNLEEIVRPNLKG